MKRIIVLLSILSIISCQKNQKQAENLGKITVDKNIVQDSMIKDLSKYPELKLFNSENIEGKKRTANIIQTVTFYDPEKRLIHFNDYKAKAIFNADTLELWLNNNNGYFGNGVKIQIFDNRFKINDINPKTLKNEVKFIKTKPFLQKLVLNKSRFKRSDSIYGFINYTSQIDSLVEKNFKGYFKTVIH
ncbi:hypothetical protein ACM46_03335 [Chryseobacterium angstadtii]|uniref:Lipoprotein n=1 Tax=Chryseobacterium angstadtii TaxID=558151 RepID=A0A0J7LCF0_9FLAO|nr:hypothetical protein [Chryseobacterium angstadtii]KMQ66575.1 hypothetical protein ACM46_03335 [Chryseobacterium angstadtii]